MTVFEKLKQYYLASGRLKFIIIYLLLFVVYVLLIPQFEHATDGDCWIKWTQFIFVNGLKKAYRSGTDYLPAMHYIFYLFGKFEGSSERIESNIKRLCCMNATQR